MRQETGTRAGFASTEEVIVTAYLARTSPVHNECGPVLLSHRAGNSHLNALHHGLPKPQPTAPSGANW